MATPKVVFSFLSDINRTSNDARRGPSPVMPPQFQLPEEAEMRWQTLNGELTFKSFGHFF
jgi:hypothetical protein